MLPTSAAQVYTLFTPTAHVCDFEDPKGHLKRHLKKHL